MSSVADTHHELEAVQIIERCHVEGRGNDALFLLAANGDAILVVRR